MIKKLNIQCFKSIEAAELELGHVNVFIGANGSGKSNLLEALAMLAAAAYGRVDEESLIRRGCRPEGIFIPQFESTPLNSNVLLEATNDHESYLVELFNPEIRNPYPTKLGYKRELLQSAGRTIVDRSATFAGNPEAGLAALKMAEMSPNDPAVIFFSELASFSIYTPETPVLRGLQQDPQIREPIGLSGGGLKEAVCQIDKHEASAKKLQEEMRSSIEWFEELHAVFIPNPSIANEFFPFLTFRDRFFRKRNEHDGSPVLSVTDVNEGALYLLFLSVLCLHPAAPKLFALDNADHGLNPRLARRLMRTMCDWLLERGSQMLMTTQNPLVLDGLPLQDERVRLFTLDRDNSGKTQVRRFMITPQHLKMASEGWTLSRMWVNGLIGGVPDV